MEDITYTLAASSNRGRYSLDSEDGPDITNGQSLSLYLNGEWIPGHVEHSQEMYPNQGLQQLFEQSLGPHVIGGYFFVGANGGICGLCIGMEVRLR